MRDTVWVTRDGRAILVSDMSDSHLRNAIQMILRHPDWRRRYLDRLQLEVTIRELGLRCRGKT